MQEKTIKSVLKKKLDDWLEHVSVELLRDQIRRDAICTGGAITSLLVGEQPNDFDIYFKTRETTKAVAEYYVDHFKENPPSSFKDDPARLVAITVREELDRIKVVVKSQGVASESGTKDYQYFEGLDDPSEPEAFVEQIAKDKEEADKKPEKKKYRPVFLTTNAITLSDKIQLIIRFFGSVEEIHDNYDFIHCTCSWQAETGELRLPNAALVSLINKRLKYKTSKYPLCSIIRTRKFLKRGWHIDAGQYLKMAWDLNQLDLTNMAVLEDQLTGVDSAYFYEVIRLLEEGKKAGKEIDSTYLIEVVDKIFG